ncbi:MAG: restriction endonuclease [Verrucomicrobia bacterium]|nr:restriction endonuclease [Verrucomicrobiota bacterium]MCH8513882.1 restriction endonuclease [Kiritimatiellia bacterium]
MKKRTRKSAISAALKVLQDAGEPLHYQEITRRALDSGLWQTSGKTPDATINAQLAVDIKKKGAASDFRREGRGVFGLNSGVIIADSSTETLVVPEKRKTAGRRRVKAAGALSFTDATERVLEDSGGNPRHYRDITLEALERGLLNTEGKTPEATLYAQVLTECKRRKGRGDQPRFMVLGKGMITLTKWQAKGLGYQVEEANRKARQELLKLVKEMPPTEFEELVGRLLAAIGFEEVEVTSRSNDGGIDVRGTLVVGDVIRTRLAVQVKRWRQNVQSPVVQQVRGSLGAHEQGLIITTSDFSKGAKEEAERSDATPVGLMDGEQLVALLVENEIGVTKTPLQLIQLGEDSSGAAG